MINLYGFRNDSWYIISNRKLYIISKRQSFVISKWKSAGHNSPTVKRGRFTLVSYWFYFDAGNYALLITALRPCLRAVSIWLPSDRNGSALEKRIINHFKMTVIYHIERTVLAPAFGSRACRIRLPAACHSRMRMTTRREPNGFTTQVQILISKGMSYSFRRENHLSYRKESSAAIFGCEQRLVLGFIRDFERIIISDLPCVSSCIQECSNTVVNRIFCDATPCVGISTNPALNDSRTAGIFIL